MGAPSLPSSTFVQLLVSDNTAPPPKIIYFLQCFVLSAGLQSPSIAYWVLFKLRHKTIFKQNWELFDMGHILKQLGKLKICDIIEDVCKVTRHRVLCTVLHSMPFGGQTKGMRKCFALKSNFAVRGTSNYQHLRIRYGCLEVSLPQEFFLQTQSNLHQEL